MDVPGYLWLFPPWRLGYLGVWGPSPPRVDVWLFIYRIIPGPDSKFLPECLMTKTSFISGFASIFSILTFSCSNVHFHLSLCFRFLKNIDEDSTIIFISLLHWWLHLYWPIIIYKHLWIFHVHAETTSADRWIMINMALHMWAQVWESPTLRGPPPRGGGPKRTPSLRPGEKLETPPETLKNS